MFTFSFELFGVFFHFALSLSLSVSLSLSPPPHPISMSFVCMLFLLFLSVSVCLCLSVCPSVCLSACLSVCLSLSVSPPSPPPPPRFLCPQPRQFCDLCRVNGNSSHVNNFLVIFFSTDQLLCGTGNTFPCLYVYYVCVPCCAC